MSAQEQRYHQLKKTILEAYDLLFEYERRLNSSENPKEKLRSKYEIEDIKANIQGYEAEIAKIEAEVSQVFLSLEPTGKFGANLPVTQTHKEDWDGAMDVTLFYGRQRERDELERWIVNEHCRLIALLGIGGIGKTALSLKVAQKVREDFVYVFWRSLKDAPPIYDILIECIKFLSNQTKVILPELIENQLLLLADILRKQRCLIVFDNFESVLREGDRAGQYRVGYEGYGRFIQIIGESTHQSCLILTSREKPKDLVVLEGKTSPVRSIALKGLGNSESRGILEDKDLSGSEQAWIALINRYAGNPLALKLVAEPIQELFGGDIDLFLKNGAAQFDGINKMLKQQFSRLSELEKEIMYWLTIGRDLVSPDDLLNDIVRLSELEKEIMYWLVIEREGVSAANLLNNVISPLSKQELYEELASLRRRSMVETVQANFTLQPVIMEHMTDQFNAQICEEISSARIKLLASHALIKAQSKEYIRNSQTRLILKPIAEKLLATFRGEKLLEERLRHIIIQLKNKSPLVPGYAAGNILNLLCQIQSNFKGFDFSDLTITQAYLQNVELHYVNFARSNLANSVFMETFGSIFSVAFSPDNNFLAAASVDGEVRLWQINSGKELITLSHANLIWSIADKSDGWVWSIAFNFNSTILASGNDNSIIKLWDVSTGECLNILQGHTDRVWSVAFSSDGEKLVSASDDQTVRVWEVSTGQCVGTLEGHTRRVISAVFSPDGKNIVSGSEDASIKIWDVDTRQCLNTLEGHTGQVKFVRYNPAGTLIASASEDRTIKLWDINTRECLKTLQGHSKTVLALAFNSDGSKLVSSSEDQTLRLWEVQTGQCLNTLQGHTNLIWSVAFNPNGSIFASGSEDQTLRLWDVKIGQSLNVLQGYTNQVWSVAYSPYGNVIASGNEDRTLKLWDITTGECVKNLRGHSNRIRSVAFSPNGLIVASGCEDFTVKLWNVTSGQCLKTLQGHTSPVWSVAFSPDISTIVSASDDQTLKLWNITTGKCIRTLEGSNSPIWSVAFSPEGSMLVSGHEDQTLKLWDVQSGQVIKTFTGHSSVVRSVTFSSNGRFLLSGGSGDQTLKLWDVQSGQCLKTLQGHKSFVKTVAFGLDDIVASGSDDQTIKLWNITTGECLITLQGHTDPVKSVRFSPDGKMLVSGSEDATVRIWDVKTGICLKILKSAKPYENMNITDVTGLTEAQKVTLKTLGAIENG